MKSKITFSLCMCKQDFEVIFSFPVGWFGEFMDFLPLDSHSPKNFYIVMEKIKKEKGSEKDQHFTNTFTG